MKVIIVFWLNSDNFQAVILRKPELTIRQQIERYCEDHSEEHPEDFFGHEVLVEEQE